jgi:chromosome segregation ATPase
VTGNDQAILQAIERVEARLDARLERMEGRMSNLEGRMATLEGRMSTIELVVAEVDVRLKSWPDMHYLAAAARAQIAHSQQMKSDVSDIKIRMNEIYQAMATDPEIRNLREEVGRFRDQSVALEVRVTTLEGHAGLDTTLTPR